MVGLIGGYNMWKILFDSLEIEVRMSFFDWQIFFRIFIKIHNIEIRNNLSEWSEFFYAFAFLIGQDLILNLTSSILRHFY